MRAPNDERLARAALSRLAEPGDEELAALVLREGPVAVWRGIEDGSLSAKGLLRWRSRLDDRDPEADLARMEMAGGRLVCPGDFEWPSQLDLPAPWSNQRPLALWVRGEADMRLSCLRSVAVVGARAATTYGASVATELAASLAEKGWTVVSGAAFGIDAAAHRGALAVGGVTVAVLACGADVSYPRSHDALLRQIGDEGVVVSELPPGCAPSRMRFLVRNRIIAALTRGTVVVEAALRSGARSTAGHAGHYGREVMAVPGPVTSALSAGCHETIREGALCVTGAADVIEAVGVIGVDVVEERRGAERPTDQLDPDSLQVFEALPVRRPAQLAGLVRRSGLDPGTVLRCLGALQREGFAEGSDAGWRMRPPEPSS